MTDRAETLRLGTRELRTPGIRTPGPRTPGQGSGHRGSGRRGTGRRGAGHRGSGHRGSGHQGSGHQGSGRRGPGHQGSFSCSMRTSMDTDLFPPPDSTSYRCPESKNPAASPAGLQRPSVAERRASLGPVHFGLQPFLLLFDLFFFSLSYKFLHLLIFLKEEGESEREIMAS